MSELGGADWRPNYRAKFPKAATWIAEAREDLSGLIPSIRVPALLLWGDRDPISPIAVGERLASLLPEATLRIIPGGEHDFPTTHAAEVAPLIEDFLRA